MGAHDEARKHLILDGINNVFDDAQDVKSTEDRLRQLHVLTEWNRWIVPATHWIGCGNNRAACLQRRNDARFRYRNALLLHSLVD